MIEMTAFNMNKVTAEKVVHTHYLLSFEELIDSTTSTHLRIITSVCMWVYISCLCGYFCAIYCNMGEKNLPPRLLSGHG